MEQHPEKRSLSDDWWWKVIPIVVAVVLSGGSPILYNQIAGVNGLVERNQDEIAALKLKTARIEGLEQLFTERIQSRFDLLSSQITDMSRRLSELQRSVDKRSADAREDRETAPLFRSRTGSETPR